MVHSNALFFFQDRSQSYVQFNVLIGFLCKPASHCWTCSRSSSFSLSGHRSKTGNLVLYSDQLRSDHCAHFFRQIYLEPFYRVSGGCDRFLLCSQWSFSSHCALICTFIIPSCHPDTITRHLYDGLFYLNFAVMTRFVIYLLFFGSYQFENVCLLNHLRGWWI